MNQSAASPITSEQIHISLFHAERTPYASLNGRMEHSHWAFSHVLRGDVWTAAGGARFHAPAGSVMIHPPRLPYTERGQTPGTHEWLVFEAGIGPHLDLFRLYPLAPVVMLHDPIGWSKTFGRLLTLWQGPETPVRALRMHALAADLLTEIAEAWHLAGMPPRPPSWMTPEDRFSEMIGYMTEHLSDTLTRQSLAMRAHLHPASLDRAFQQTYGTTPMAMLRAMRIERARRLLERTDWPLTAVAEACGLEDAAYLGRVFRRRFGLSPGEHRQAIRKSGQLYAEAVEPEKSLEPERQATEG